MPTKVVVNLAQGKSYGVRIGNDLLAGLGTSVKKIEAVAQASRFLIITDSTVGALYGNACKLALKQEGYKVSLVQVHPGEKSKSLEVAAELLGAMQQLNMDRSSAVVALGGGVVSDLAGFVAAVYQRGIPCVYVPTTLLAMVDAAIGGKTGVNLGAVKNQVGTITQPVYVCESLDVLGTLPDEEWLNGCAEIIKTALLAGDESFFWLCEHAEALRARDPEVVAEAITRCVTYKAAVVSADECDTLGQRACLNYGHTFAHALEAASAEGGKGEGGESAGEDKGAAGKGKAAAAEGKGAADKSAGAGEGRDGGPSDGARISHGRAVAEGMRFVADLAVAGGIMPAEIADAQNEILDTLGLPAQKSLPSSQSLFDAMKHDKKNAEGMVHFVMLTEVGHWELVPVEEEALMEALQAWTVGKE